MTRFPTPLLADLRCEPPLL